MSMINDAMGEPVKLKTSVSPANGKATTSPTSGSDCNLDFAQSQLSICGRKSDGESNPTREKSSESEPHGSLEIHGSTGKNGKISYRPDACITKTATSQRTSGLWSCIEPLWAIFGRRESILLTGYWEIPFEYITDLEWIGSGSQGAVFSGKYNSQLVAVKKVKHQEEALQAAEICKLNHENIVSFM